MAKTKFYVVIKGVVPGIYTTWGECEAQVKGFKGAEYKSYPTRAEADAVFASGTVKREVKSISGTTHSGATELKEMLVHAPTPTVKAFVSKTGRECISVDVGTHGNPGVMEYRIVAIPSGKTLFHSPQYALGTNNIGEFLALVDSIRYARQQDQPLDIYTDSVTAQAWYREKRMNTTMNLSRLPLVLQQKIQEVLAYLAAESSDYPYIYKWDTKKYGDIPADFGRKS